MSADLAAQAAGTIPVSVLTGYLGSGKTTLLNALLRHPDMGETAVLINEYGDVGIDHLLVREIAEDVVLLESGCLCCNVRGDLVNAMRELFLKRVRGEVPEFRRLVIETTGLADPAPILHTLMTDPLLGARYRLDGIVATVDCVLGSKQLDRHDESVKQAAVADRLVLTKTDLADPVEVEVLRARLARLNPTATQIVAACGAVSPGALFDAGLVAPGRAPDVDRWLGDAAYARAVPAHHHDPHLHGNRHDDHVAAFAVTFAAPVNWVSLVSALELLVALKGEHLLRVKGIVNRDDSDRPVVVHGVQHLFHPPVELPRWPSDDHRTRLVFITRDLPRQAIDSLLSTVLTDGQGGAER